MVTQSDTEGLFLYESIKLCGKYSDASLITVLSIHRVERTLAERGRSRRKREREREGERELTHSVASPRYSTYWANVKKKKRITDYSVDFVCVCVWARLPHTGPHIALSKSVRTPDKEN